MTLSVVTLSAVVQGGDATAGPLTKYYEGGRPSDRTAGKSLPGGGHYSPMKKEVKLSSSRRSTQLHSPHLSSPLSSSPLSSSPLLSFLACHQGMAETHEGWPRHTHTRAMLGPFLTMVAVFSFSHSLSRYQGMAEKREKARKRAKLPVVGLGTL